MIRLLLVIIVLIVLASACGEPQFEKHNAGNVELWTGSRVPVEAECRRRGTIGPNDASIYGCTDFTRATIISVTDPAVIAHEFCHWTLRTADHNTCRTPLVGG